MDESPFIDTVPTTPLLGDQDVFPRYVTLPSSSIHDLQLHTIPYLVMFGFVNKQTDALLHGRVALYYTAP